MKKNTIRYLTGLLLAAAALLPAILPLGRTEHTPQPTTEPSATQPTAQTTQPTTQTTQPTQTITIADNGTQALGAVLDAVAAEEAEEAEDQTPQHPLTLKADPEGTRFGPWY